jgi:hypothetical protein
MFAEPSTQVHKKIYLKLDPKLLNKRSYPFVCIKSQLQRYSLILFDEEDKPIKIESTDKQFLN